MLDPYTIRQQFPALRRVVGGRTAVYFDGPGGTQVPQSVIDAMTGFMEAGGSNLGGPFATSVETEEVVDGARQAIADLFNADPNEIAFGQNMTSLTFAMSRALAATWEPGDEIVLTKLDHDANVRPWVLAAADAGVSVRWADVKPRDGVSFDYESLEDALSEKTKLVAVTAASNATGTVVDVRQVTRMAHRVGALVYVDAVHYTPHQLVDVAAIDCDFVAASAYKFFGPHTGVLYGRKRLLDSLTAYKVEPASDHPPEKWETGTQSFESLAGVTAAVDYMATLGGGGSDRRAALRNAYRSIQQYEEVLAARLQAGLERIDGITIYGLTDGRDRTPTYAIDVAGQSAQRVSELLGAVGIFVWAGHYYAVEVMRRLGVLDSGGLVRIGLTHYNTDAEVDRLLNALEHIAAGRDPSAASELAPRVAGGAMEPYEAFGSDGLPDPRHASRGTLAAGLAEVVAVEGPMTEDRAYQVFIKASGGKKVTKPVRDDLSWALDLLVREGRVETEELTISDGERQRILRLPEMPRVRMRELGDRDLYKVPITEVAEVVADVVHTDRSLDDEAVKRATLERYGLKRLTDSADAYLEAARRVAGV
ncbi:MAG: cysteine desulfurase-like protein [Acidimicrobiia bacterium]|nr:cysteine desulfurase-like protein [Acidimicrobiia bacterium]